MNLAASLHRLVQILVAPHAAFAGLRRQPHVGSPLLLVGMLAAALLLVQSYLMEPALGEPFGLQGETERTRPAWLAGLRLLVLLAAPLGIALRATALGSILQALQLAAGGQSSWRRCTALAVHLEAVYLVESACTLVVLASVRPQSLAELQELRLRAGIDLFWQPDSPLLQALVSAANLFVLWWGALLLEGTARIGGLGRRRAALLTSPLWLAGLALRVLLQPR